MACATNFSLSEREAWKNSGKRYLDVVRYLSFDGTPMFGNPFDSIPQAQVDKSFIRLTELLSNSNAKLF